MYSYNVYGAKLAQYFKQLAFCTKFELENTSMKRATKCNVTTQKYSMVKVLRSQQSEGVRNVNMLHQHNYKTSTQKLYIKHSKVYRECPIIAGVWGLRISAINGCANNQISVCQSMHIILSLKADACIGRGDLEIAADNLIFSVPL